MAVVLVRPYRLDNRGENMIRFPIAAIASVLASSLATAQSAKS
jgi:hypothetical protein